MLRTLRGGGTCDSDDIASIPEKHPAPLQTGGTEAHDVRGRTRYRVYRTNSIGTLKPGAAIRLTRRNGGFRTNAGRTGLPAGHRSHYRKAWRGGTMKWLLCLVSGHQRTLMPFTSNRFSCRRCGADLGRDIPAMPTPPAAALPPPPPRISDRAPRSLRQRSLRTGKVGAPRNQIQKPNFDGSSLLHGDLTDQWASG